jgi:tetratricopeptide (TPR) repeat protein
MTIIRPICASTLSFCLLFTGCSSNLLKDSEKPELLPNNANTSSNSTEKIKSFKDGTLYHLLVADIALMRQNYETALSIYSTQAQYTRDEAIAEMAFGIAHNIRRPAKALALAKLWLEINPESIAAHKAVIQSYVLLRDPVSALPYAAWVSKNENNEDVFLAVTTFTERGSKEQIDSLISAYQSTSLAPGKEHFSQLAIALLLQKSDRFGEAESVIKSFLKKSKDDPRGITLLAQALGSQKKIDEALKVLKKALEKNPSNEDLRIHYAKLLTDYDRKEALHQFELLNLSSPENQEIKYLLALLYIDQQLPDLAYPKLRGLIASKRFSHDALFHLGVITENKGEHSAALHYYARVTSGRHFLMAVSRSVSLISENYDLSSARLYLSRLRETIPDQAIPLFELEAQLLVKDKREKEAINLLTAGLSRNPENKSLLYARAMIAERQGNFDKMENDLRAIISQDPENASALNALGYSMVLHTKRFQEAYDLIYRAYLLQPNSAAIVDSMGWVLFKRGELKQALYYIKKAMTMMPDPEIAAHLGEIYWQMGDRDLARKAWAQGLKKSPNHKNIITTMYRLNASVINPESIK